MKKMLYLKPITKCERVIFQDSMLASSTGVSIQGFETSGSYSDDDWDID